MIAIKIMTKTKTIAKMKGFKKYKKLNNSPKSTAKTSIRGQHKFHEQASKDVDYKRQYNCLRP